MTDLPPPSISVVVQRIVASAQTLMFRNSPAPQSPGVSSQHSFPFGIPASMLFNRSQIEQQQCLQTAHASPVSSHSGVGDDEGPLFFAVPCEGLLENYLILHSQVLMPRGGLPLLHPGVLAILAACKVLSSPSGPLHAGTDTSCGDIDLDVNFDIESGIIELCARDCRPAKLIDAIDALYMQNQTSQRIAIGDSVSFVVDSTDIDVDGQEGSDITLSSVVQQHYASPDNAETTMPPLPEFITALKAALAEVVTDVLYKCQSDINVASQLQLWCLGFKNNSDRVEGTSSSSSYQLSVILERLVTETNRISDDLLLASFRNVVSSLNGSSTPERSCLYTAVEAEIGGVSPLSSPSMDHLALSFFHPQALTLSPAHMALVFPTTSSAMSSFEKITRKISARVDQQSTLNDSGLLGHHSSLSPPSAHQSGPSFKVLIGPAVEDVLTLPRRKLLTVNADMSPLVARVGRTRIDEVRTALSTLSKLRAINLRLLEGNDDDDDTHSDSCEEAPASQQQQYESSMLGGERDGDPQFHSGLASPVTELSDDTILLGNTECPFSTLHNISDDDASVIVSTPTSQPSRPWQVVGTERWNEACMSLTDRAEHLETHVEALKAELEARIRMTALVEQHRSSLASSADQQQPTATQIPPTKQSSIILASPDVKSQQSEPTTSTTTLSLSLSKLLVQKACSIAITLPISPMKNPPPGLLPPVLKVLRSPLAPPEALTTEGARSSEVIVPPRTYNTATWAIAKIINQLSRYYQIPLDFPIWDRGVYSRVIDPVTNTSYPLMNSPTPIKGVGEHVVSDRTGVDQQLVVHHPTTGVESYAYVLVNMLSKNLERIRINLGLPEKAVTTSGKDTTSDNLLVSLNDLFSRHLCVDDGIYIPVVNHDASSMEEFKNVKVKIRPALNSGSSHLPSAFMQCMSAPHAEAVTFTL
eukprot:gnl/Dysnectes_brevis/6568_a10295_288.p1 GENE.gnl/Dysnectes_brevis/6568_a10295_288~~gnl/Dysnectes_brevis/6568_a10295_288.p1  ORF type:complete len:1070 (-),score=173.04 gnl/Dysnectes_brevis/6568_a10295_288:59-2848(-)